MSEESIRIDRDEINSEIIVEYIDENIQANETIDVIEVEKPQETEIIIEETIGWSGSNGSITHRDLQDKDDKDQHTIGSITHLEEVLDTLGSAQIQYSNYSGFAEFQEWKSDGIYKNEIYKETDNGAEVSYESTGGVGFLLVL